MAVDFDQTLVSLHTGGAWKATGPELAKYVRPTFQHFLSETMASGIHVAIVTYTPQTDLVREVLELSFGEQKGSSLPIRGNDGSWTYNGKGTMAGKQPHMTSAVEELEQVHEGLDVTKQSTVLIDDDGSNIRTALAEGVRGVWLNPDNGRRILKDIIRLK